MTWMEGALLVLMGMVLGGYGMGLVVLAGVNRTLMERRRAALAVVIGWSSLLLVVAFVGIVARS